MPFEVPTRDEILQRTLADVQAELGTGPLLRRSVLRALSTALSGSATLLHAHIGAVARQVFPDTASAEFLAQWARVWGLERRPATPAAGLVDVAGSTGALVPAGTLLRNGAGAEYSTDAEVTLLSGAAQPSVTAAEPGTAGDLPAGANLTFITPIASVTSQATVAAEGLTGGQDTELDADLRLRVLQRISVPPHGGAERDYEAWALEVPGVERAWVIPLHGGLGSVGVTFTQFDTGLGRIPDAAMVATVQAYLDVVRPVTAQIIVFAPTAVPIAVEVNVVPNTAVVQAEVQAALDDFFAREAAPGGTLILSRMAEAISSAQGETSHVLVTPAADVTVLAAELAVLGVITW